MCHVSGPCPAVCPYHHLFLTKDKENQSTVQLDATFVSTMPPLHAARLAALTPDLRWNLCLALSAFCSLVVVFVLATRRWRQSRHIGALAIQHGGRQDSKPDAKSGDSVYSDILAQQPFAYLPAPPGSILADEQRAGPIPLPHFNSGALAAQGMAKLWPDLPLIAEPEVRHPWRRHSHPLSKASTNGETQVFITGDADQYFEDADLNGFWRRRTLVFG